MSNPIIETDLAEILRDIQGYQKKILEEINTLKVGQAELKREIKAVGEKLSGQIKAVDTKVDQIEN